MPLSITKPDIKWPFQCSLKNSDKIPKGIPMKFLKSAKIYSGKHRLELVESPKFQEKVILCPNKQAPIMSPILILVL